ncbi:ABC transporter permease subunit [Streptomyces pacificus]|uniref:ABC transporter permease subunit n=1 Tax=Streptomyces pacificus TaxID=2705029 RepID=A0A6A0AZM0_9ACTN|nr:ABC transporter permease subunit [Streptomyces pacificus]GFH37781.1 ABC transporter permease subunit [Streptomyces pacificus]
MTVRTPPRLRGLLLAAPALAVVGFAAAALLLAARGSLADGLGRGWSLSAYADLLRDPALTGSLPLSLEIAALSTAVSAAAALAVVGAVSGSRRARAALDAAARATLAVPHLLAAAAFGLLLSGAGLLSRLARAAGWTDGAADFPALVGGPGHTAVLLTYVWKEAPFVTIMLLAAYTPAVRDLETAARTLGAGRLRRLRHVTLPLLAPALTEACLLVFAFTFAAYEIPALLGATAPRALPVEAVGLYRSVELGDRPGALALAVVIGLVIALAATAAAVVSRRLLRARTGP